MAGIDRSRASQSCGSTYPTTRFASSSISISNSNSISAFPMQLVHFWRGSNLFSQVCLGFGCVESGITVEMLVHCTGANFTRTRFCKILHYTVFGIELAETRLLTSNRVSPAQAHVCVFRSMEEQRLLYSPRLQTAGFEFSNHASSFAYPIQLDRGQRTSKNCAVDSAGIQIEEEREQDDNNSPRWCSLFLSRSRFFDSKISQLFKETGNDLH